MADLITWSPRVGATGDDRYNVPDDTPVRAGSSSFSSPPTIAEVNAATDINQVAAEINRRRFTDQQLLWSIPAISYVAAGDRISPTYLATTLRNAIDRIRLNDDQSAYSWTAGLAANSPIRKAHIFDLRKALATPSLIVYPPNAYWPSNCVERFGTTHPTYTTTRVRTNNVHVLYAGKSVNYYANPQTIRFRSFLHFQIPTDLPAFSTAKLCCYANYTGGNPTPYTWEVWRSNSFLGATDAGDYDLGLDTFEDSETVTDTGPGQDRVAAELSLDPAPIVAGALLTYVLVTNLERVGGYIQSTNEHFSVEGPITDDVSGLSDPIFLKLE